MDKCTQNQSCYNQNTNECANNICKDKTCEKSCCSYKLKTYNCDPNDKNMWFKHILPPSLDPVLSNIYNGCWLCNYEPQQTRNDRLCARQFLDTNIKPPYMKTQVNDRNMMYLFSNSKKNNKFCL